MGKKHLRKKNKETVNLKTERFCTALLTQLVMTAESMLSKRPVLRIIYCGFTFPSYAHFVPYVLYCHVALFFPFKLFFTQRFDISSRLVTAEI